MARRYKQSAVQSGRSFPVNEPALGPGQRDKKPTPKKQMAGGFGTTKPTRPRETAVVAKSRATLIKRLGIVTHSKRG